MPSVKTKVRKFLKEIRKSEGNLTKIYVYDGDLPTPETSIRMSISNKVARLVSNVKGAVRVWFAIRGLVATSWPPEALLDRAQQT